MIYFYTDPLAAAWMAKHHKINIFTASNAAVEKPIYIECDFAAEDIERVAMMANLSPSRYYIHTDSVSLLEPKADDLLEIVKHIKTASNEGDVTVFARCYRANAEEADPLIVYDNGSFLEVYKDAKIIQRNGIAFMWPEIE